MNLLKKYKIVVIIVAPILILVMIRTFGKDNFKSDSRRWAEPSFSMSNIITIKDIGTIPGNTLLIRLDSIVNVPENKNITQISVSPDSIFGSRFLGRIKSHKGNVILASTDISLSAKLWMIISQTGVKDLFILENEKDQEVFKYEFLPDTGAVDEF